MYCELRPGEPGKWFYHHVVAGSNLRMTEWQGAILLGQLDRFPEQNRIRNRNAVELGERSTRDRWSASTAA